MILIKIFIGLLTAVALVNILERIWRVGREEIPKSWTKNRFMLCAWGIIAVLTSLGVENVGILIVTMCSPVVFAHLRAVSRTGLAAPSEASMLIQQGKSVIVIKPVVSQDEVRPVHGWEIARQLCQNMKDGVGRMLKYDRAKSGDEPQ